MCYMKIEGEGKKGEKDRKDRKIKMPQNISSEKFLGRILEKKEKSQEGSKN